MPKYEILVTAEEEALLDAAVADANFHNEENHRRTKRLPVPTPLMVMTKEQMIHRIVRQTLKEVENGQRAQQRHKKLPEIEP